VEKLKLTRTLILPILLIIGVLGSIFGGVATPTEAAAIGAVGAVLCTLVNRTFTLRRIGKAGLESARLTAMIFWLLLGAKAFSAIYAAVQGRQVVAQIMTPFLENPDVVLITLMFVIFILGCIMDPGAIIIVFVPIFVPFVQICGWDPIWFGVLAMVALQMGYLTPPFAFSLFYLRAVAPPDIATRDLYNSVWPFVIIQAMAVVLCILYPQIILWLPTLMFR
jgi:tripartite ATP-independent transporter DctM subunit